MSNEVLNSQLRENLLAHYWHTIFIAIQFWGDLFKPHYTPDNFQFLTFLGPFKWWLNRKG